jgi:hypothetical protein
MDYCSDILHIQQRSCFKGDCVEGAEIDCTVELEPGAVCFDDGGKDPAICVSPP